jgi:hypothetical protein
MALQKIVLKDLHEFIPNLNHSQGCDYGGLLTHCNNFLMHVFVFVWSINPEGMSPHFTHQWGCSH